MKKFVSDRQPNKSSEDIEKIMADIQSDKTKIDYAVWNKIINHMYELKDVEIISRNLREIVRD